LQWSQLVEAIVVIATMRVNNGVCRRQGKKDEKKGLFWEMKISIPSHMVEA